MFKDNRGRGKYDVFPTLPEGQINVSYSYPGTIRAFHRHEKQWDHWYLISGNIEVALYDQNRDELSLLSLSGGADNVLEIPPMKWHGFKVLGNTEAILLYYVTNPFDPDNPDEERAPWDKFYNWETERK